MPRTLWATSPESALLRYPDDSPSAEHNSLLPTSRLNDGNELTSHLTHASNRGHQEVTQRCRDSSTGAAMSDDDHAWPSLILAKHESAHREHNHNHDHNHQHQHHLFHRGQTGATTTAVQSIVTEITATVSVVQQIDVDTNGSTFTIQTVLADSTQGYLAATTSSSATSTTSASPAEASSSSSSASSTTAAGSGSSASQSLNTTSTSSTSTLSTSFASLIASSNSTTLISSTSSSSHFSNSSVVSTSSSSSSFTYLTSSSSSSSEESSTSTSSTSSLYSPSSSTSVVATSTGGGIAGGTAGSTGSASTTTAASGSGGSSNANTPSTPVVVGGVVGGIAGAAILIFILLAFIRWKKRHQSMLQLGSGNEGAGAGAATSRDGPPPSQLSGGMTERRSLAFVPSALANLTGLKRGSRQTDRTVSTAESERGFYRVSGRKLPSVLQTGGDGYGGGINEPNTLSGSSFYRDSQGFYGGSGTAAAGTSTRPESGVPVMRPSPARTPVTQQGPFSAAAAAPAPLTPPPPRPDLVGRSHPSQDGSHVSSRFTEEV